MSTEANNSDGGGDGTQVCRTCIEAKPISGFAVGMDECIDCLKRSVDVWYSNKKQVSISVAIPEGFKHCHQCNTNKPIEVFKYGKSSCYDCQKKMSNAWKAKNRDKMNAYNKEYKAENKEELKEYNAAYFKANQQAIQARNIANVKRLKEENPSFKMKCVLSDRLRGVLSGKLNAEATFKLIGCTRDFFIAWLEYNFSDSMSMDNHGKGWHMDHVIPGAMFDLTKEDEQAKCFHWSNTRPLDPWLNQTKNKYITQELVEEHVKRVRDFIGEHGKGAGTSKVCYTEIDIDWLSYVSKP